MKQQSKCGGKERWHRPGTTFEGEKNTMSTWDPQVTVLLYLLAAIQFSSLWFPNLKELRQPAIFRSEVSFQAGKFRTSTLEFILVLSE